jgi:hypothetical protein
MNDKSLSDLVVDWGGFERLVAQLHETGHVSVEHNVKLVGRSGAQRQIDVLVRHTEGLYEHLIIIECKHWNSRVKRQDIDEMAVTIRELGASRGVIFSTKGFQKGAIRQAKHETISLFRLREPTDAEWGLPGRHVDVWLHVVSFSLGKLDVPGAFPIGAPLVAPLNIAIALGDGGPTSNTPVKIEGKPDTTLEEFLMRSARTAAEVAYKPTRINFDGKFDGELKYVINVNVAPEQPMLIFVPQANVIVPRLSYRLGVKVNQSRIQIDRAEKYAFVLAVEDCIQNTVTAASRARDQEFTELAPLNAPRETDEPAWVNGSIITVWIKPFVEFSEFAGLEPATGPEVQEVKMKI